MSVKCVKKFGVHARNRFRQGGRVSCRRLFSRSSSARQDCQRSDEKENSFHLVCHWIHWGGAKTNLNRCLWSPTAVREYSVRIRDYVEDSERHQGLTIEVTDRRWR